MDLESTVKCFHQQVPNHTMNLAEYSYPPSSFKKERKGKNKRIQKKVWNVWFQWDKQTL